MVGLRISKIKHIDVAANSIEKKLCKLKLPTNILRYRVLVGNFLDYLYYFIMVLR